MRLLAYRQRNGYRSLEKKDDQFCTGTQKVAKFHVLEAFRRDRGMPAVGQRTATSFPRRS